VLLALVELAQLAQPLQLMVVNPYTEVFLLKVVGQAVRPLFPCHLEMVLARVALAVQQLLQLLLRLLAQQWDTQLVGLEGLLSPLPPLLMAVMPVLLLSLEVVAGEHSQLELPRLHRVVLALGRHRQSSHLLVEVVEAPAQTKPQQVSLQEALAVSDWAVREQLRCPLLRHRLLVSRPLVAEERDI
jgi:hypothetical protein